MDSTQQRDFAEEDFNRREMLEEGLVEHEAELAELKANAHIINIVDLGGPDGGRYWKVTSGHLANHPDALHAAALARVTGSRGATADEVTVEAFAFVRQPRGEEMDRPAAQKKDVSS